MSLIVYVNGKFVPEAEATVSVFDHGVLYGDGVFEGIRSYNGRVFKLREHLERLYESAKSILLEIPMGMEELEAVTLETLRRNGIRDGYIRHMVTRGRGDLGLNPVPCKSPSLIIIASKISLFPPELYEKGLEVVTVATRRNIPDALDPKIKSLNYLNNILVRMEANRAGVLEAIMMNREGYITEGSGDNIFIVRRGKLITPPAYLGILEGITRRVVLELAAERGYAVKEEPFTRHDLYTAAECFLTGTAAELIPVVKVDERTIGTGQPGPITRRLMQDYKELTSTTGVEIYREGMGYAERCG
jgi:branched-chain amino acid aminotransferase